MAHQPSRPIGGPGAQLSLDAEPLLAESVSAMIDAPEPSEQAQPKLAAKFTNPRTLISFGIAIVLLGFTISKAGIDPRKTLTVIRSANLWLFLLAFVVYYSSFPLRGLRWRLLMTNANEGAERQAVQNYPLTDTTEILYLSWFVNCIVPAKLGDVYRAYLARRCIGVSWTHTVGTVMAERLLDLLVLLPLLAISTLLTFNQHLEHAAGSAHLSTVFVFGGILAGAAILVLIALWRFHALIATLLPARLAHYFVLLRNGVIDGLHGNVIGPLLLTVVVWCLEGGRLLCVLAALGLFHQGDLGIAAALFLALGSSVLTTLPITPGGLAFVEIFLISGITFLGVHNTSQAASVTVLDRTISFLSLIVIGAIIYIFSAKTHASQPVPAAAAAHH